MLKASGEKTEGNKAVLAARLAEHATVDTALSADYAMSEGCTESFSDLQVAYFLQQEGVTLAATWEKLSSQFMKIVCASISELELQEQHCVTDSSASGNEDEPAATHKQLKQRVDVTLSDSNDDAQAPSLEEQNRELRLRIKALEKMPKPKHYVRSLHSRISKAAHEAAESSAADDEQLSSEDGDIKVNDDKGQSSRSRRHHHHQQSGRVDHEGFSTMAAAIATAIQDGFSGMGDASASASTDSKLERTHPALVDPRAHGQDPGKMGLIIKKMIQFNFDDTGLSAVIYRRSNKELTSLIHSLTHANTSRVEYEEGKSLFLAFVTSSLALASQHDKEAERYALARTPQLARFHEAFCELKQDLKDALRDFHNADHTFRMQMEELITTALGVGMTNARIRNLKASYSLLNDLGSDSRDSYDYDTGFNDGGRAAPGPALPFRPPHHPDPQPSGWSNVNNNSDVGKKRGRDQGTSGGGGGQSPGKGKLAHQNVTWNCNVGNDASKPPDRDKRKCCDLMPTAMSIIGCYTSTKGAEEVDNVCQRCSQGGLITTCHCVFECAAQFVADNPNKLMPGFTSTGARDPSAWNGDNITRSTKIQWIRMQSLGYFTTNPYRKHPGIMPDMRK
eukprot:1509457-Rhodomonas_salina.1